MSRVDTTSNANFYLAGAGLGTRQFGMLQDMRARDTAMAADERRFQSHEQARAFQQQQILEARARAKAERDGIANWLRQRIAVSPPAMPDNGVLGPPMPGMEFQAPPSKSDLAAEHLLDTADAQTLLRLAPLLEEPRKWAEFVASNDRMYGEGWREPELIDDEFTEERAGLSLAIDMKRPDLVLKARERLQTRQRLAGEAARIRAGLPPELQRATIGMDDETLIRTVNQQGQQEFAKAKSLLAAQGAFATLDNPKATPAQKRDAQIALAQMGIKMPDQPQAPTRRETQSLAKIQFDQAIAVYKAVAGEKGKAGTIAPPTPKDYEMADTSDKDADMGWSDWSGKNKHNVDDVHKAREKISAWNHYQRAKQELEAAYGGSTPQGPAPGGPALGDDDLRALVQRLKDSGMSPDKIKAELAQRGIR